MSVLNLRRSVSRASSDAAQWFNKIAIIKSQSDWTARGQLGDTGAGGVYAFFDRGSCLYVGQTTQSLKSRASVKTSNHYDTVWWSRWTSVRFVNLSDRTDQLVLEMLLVLALKPEFNEKPCARDLRKIFSI